MRFVAVSTSEAQMSCKSCQSANTHTFGGEIALHFPGLKGLEMPIVWAFPPIEVCLDCSFAGFQIPERELRVLGQDVLADAKGVAA